MSIFRRLKDDEKGHFAVITALLGVPVILGIGVALDMGLVLRHDTTAQAALDSAALASVIPGDMSDDERAAFAKSVFASNYITPLDYSLEVDASREQVSVYATIEKPSLVGGIIGLDTYKIKLDATAVHTKSDIICVMTLNETAGDSLTFHKAAELTAPNCSVQVNSSAKNAMVSTASKSPEAKSFCVHGGYTGKFPGQTKSSCSSVADPYANVKPPRFLGCDYGSTGFMGWIANTYVGEQDTTLSPGVYCGGLNIYDSNIKLKPGTYTINDGALTIGHNSTVVGEDVTFVLTGEDSVLYTYEDVKLDLTAPSRGEYAGLIFYQDRTSTASSGLTSLIKGSADIRLLGTVYFPTQTLFVGGVGTMGASSPAMAFIADKITFTSDITEIVSDLDAQFSAVINYISIAANQARQMGLIDYQVSALSSSPATLNDNSGFVTSISTNHRKAGLPPILPRSDEGSRLIPTPPRPTKEPGQ